MKKKPFLTELQIHRLTLLAEHLEKCRLQNTSAKLYCKDNKPPYVLDEHGLVFICFPFVYAALEKLFPEE